MRAALNTYNISPGLFGISQGRTKQIEFQEFEKREIVVEFDGGLIASYRVGCFRETENGLILL